jgi:hypothetical protein
LILSKKVLEKLRLLINEETQYRKGFELVEFFNRLGFNDSYGNGFPSRWIYTDSKLEIINGTTHHAAINILRSRNGTMHYFGLPGPNPTPTLQNSNTTNSLYNGFLKTYLSYPHNTPRF